MVEVERLQAKDYDEILAVLNESFTHKEFSTETPHQADFRANLPIMWTGEHDYASRHLAIKENGKIISLLGVYPLPTMVAGEEIMLGTIGNVASLPSGRGKGYMKHLMGKALEEAERQGFAAARLGGFRSRYNRYDFDHAGTNTVCKLTRRNVNEMRDIPDLIFTEFSADDHAAIDFARRCHRNNLVYTLRETRNDFYYTLKAWKNVPCIARNQKGEYVGYISADQSGAHIAEWGTNGGCSVVDLLAAYMLSRPELKEIDFLLMPHESLHRKAAFAICEEWREEPASMFHVFQWDRFLHAYMKLASQIKDLPDGCLSVDVQGWGGVEIKVQDGAPNVQKTNAPTEVQLTPLEALNWFFGNFRVIHPIPESRAEASWFPLPLGWNGQDRV